MDYFLGLEGLAFAHPFDARKFQRVADDLVARGLVPRRAFVRPERIAREDLLRVHTEAYLDTLRDPRTVAKIFYLPNVMPWDVDLLDCFLYHAGGTLAAAEAALGHGGVAVNLGGGFHHAAADRGARVCAINDVAVAIRRLQAEGRARRFAIVDLDFHQGNGNVGTFARDPDVFTLSLHADHWEDFPDATRTLDLPLGFDLTDDAYLAAVRTHVPETLRRERPDLVFYVAGDDVWEHDTIGSWHVTRAGILARDRVVFETAREVGAPLVVVGGGGYHDLAWTLYAQRCAAALTGRWDVDPRFRAMDAEAA